MRGERVTTLLLTEAASHGNGSQNQGERAYAGNRVVARYAASIRPYRRASFAGPSLRLRSWPVWIVLGSGQWRRNAVVYDACVDGRRQVRNNLGWSAGVVRRAEKTCAGAGAAPGAAGDDRRAGSAVRLLLQWDD